MNAVQDYIARQSEECRTRWFKGHVAEYLAGPETAEMHGNRIGLCINWQQPGTWTYGCRYILHRRWLIVVGDIGEAVFEWSQDITPDFMLSLNDQAHLPPPSQTHK